MDDSGGIGNTRVTVCYCCVWKDGQVVHKYTTGNHHTDNMAALCLEFIPPYHRSYFETIASYTFAFLIDSDSGSGFVYFAILRHSLVAVKPHLLSFLHKLRDEFNKMGSRADHHFVPVVRRLVASLERLSEATPWPAMPVNGNAEAGTSSTKAPLLARPSKQDKKKKKNMKMKDIDLDVVTDIETPDHRLRSSSDSRGTGTSSSAAPDPLHKDLDFNSSPSRIKLNQREKWCRQVRIVLAIDAAVCILLLIIWLLICRGIHCIRS